MSARILVVPILGLGLLVFALRETPQPTPKERIVLAEPSEPPAREVRVAKEPERERTESFAERQRRFRREMGSLEDYRMWLEGWLAEAFAVRRETAGRIIDICLDAERDRLRIQEERNEVPDGSSDKVRRQLDLGHRDRLEHADRNAVSKLRALVPETCWKKLDRFRARLDAERMIQ